MVQQTDRLCKENVHILTYNLHKGHLNEKIKRFQLVALNIFSSNLQVQYLPSHQNHEGCAQRVYHEKMT